MSIFCVRMKSVIYRIILPFCVVAIAIVFAMPKIKSLLEERLPDEFNLEKIALDIQADLPLFPMPDLLHATNQSFHYLGHGGQAVAFASEDGKFVLKFFLLRSMHGKKKYPIPKPTHWIASHKKQRREKREKTAFQSLLKAMHNYAIAYQKIPEKTGILGLHLLPTKENLPKVSLYDQYGNKHEVELDRASFVFQKRATLVPVKLNTASTIEEKKQVLLALNQFFAERAKSGFIDIERSFMIEANYGFIEETPIQLDVGNIEFLESLQKTPEEEITRIQSLLQNWIQQKNLPAI